MSDHFVTNHTIVGETVGIFLQFELMSPLHQPIPTKVDVAIA